MDQERLKALARFSLVNRYSLPRKHVKARGFWDILNLVMRKHLTHVKFLKICVDTMMLLVEEKPWFGQMFNVTFGILVASRALKFKLSQVLAGTIEVSVPETTSFLSKRKKKDLSYSCLDF